MKNYVGFLFLLILCADSNLSLACAKTGYNTSGWNLQKADLIQFKMNDSLVPTEMNWNAFLSSCIYGKRSKMMNKDFAHKLSLIGFKETDHVDINSRDSILIKPVSDDFLTPVHLHLDQASDTFELMRFTDAYGKSISEYNKIKKLFIQKYVEQSTDYKIKLFDLEWNYDGDFFHTQLFVTADGKYLYDDLFFYLYRTENINIIQSAGREWEMLFDPNAKGRMSTILSRQFKGQLKLIRYKVLDTIDILTRDSLLIEPITDETMVPVPVSQTGKKNFRFNSNEEPRDSFFYFKGKGMRRRTVSEEIVPKYRLARASEPQMGSFEYQENKNRILHFLSKKWGTKCMLIRLTWEYKGKTFYSQAIVSQITKTLVYDDIFNVLLRVKSQRTTSLIKGTIMEETKEMMPDLLNSRTEVKYPGGEGTDTLCREEIKRIYNTPSDLPEFLKAYITCKAMVSGSLIYDNEWQTTWKDLNRFQLELKPHPGLFITVSGRKKNIQLNKGINGVVSYKIDYSFKMNDIPIAFEGTGISQFNVRNGSYERIINAALLK